MGKGTISEALYDQLIKSGRINLDYFLPACDRLGLVPRLAITRVCICGHLSADHDWKQTQIREHPLPPGNDPPYWLTWKWKAICQLEDCECDIFRRKISWQELRPKPTERTVTKHSADQFIEEWRPKHWIERYKANERKWLEEVNKISPRKDPENIPIKQHKECKLFRCLKCWKLILPDDDMQQYNDGYVHKICLSTERLFK